MTGGTASDGTHHEPGPDDDRSGDGSDAGLPQTELADDGNTEAEASPGDTTDPAADPASSPGRITIVDESTDDTAAQRDPDAPDPADDEHEPRLPGHHDAVPSKLAAEPVASSAPRSVPTASAYRSPDERNRSVYRRANPWYRRLARGLIALCLIGGLGVAVYFGATALQDYLDRDTLPAADPEIPTVRSTSILITSTSTELPLQGTLSFDTQTGAYEFIGLPDSPNRTDRLTSPDGEDVYVVNPNATWRVADGDEIVSTVERAISVLTDSDTADVVLTTEIRRDYADLLAKTEVGEDDDAQARYDVSLDLDSFANRYPLQWDDYQEQAIPGVAQVNNHETSLWTDHESVLVRVVDADSGWNWERLTYSADAFTPFRPPPTQLIDPITEEVATGIECTSDALAITWTTTLPTCDESEAVGRQLAVSVGLADSADSPVAELAFLSVCDTLQGDSPREADDPAYVELAGLLVDTGVCPGDTGLLTEPTAG